MPATALQTERKTFDIRDHLEQLTPTQKKNRYICPICEGNDFVVEPKSGKYHCFNNDCDNAEIRNTVAPLDNKDLSTWKPRKIIRSKRKTHKPAPLPEKIQLARLSENCQYPQKQQGTRRDRELGQCQTRTIQYQYGKGRYVERVEFYQNGERAKKICIPYHVTDTGEVKKGKGNCAWPLYRLDELQEIPLANRFILWEEGEKVVEASRLLGLASVTPPGADWTEKEIERHILTLQSSGVAGIVMIPDCDPEGHKKAQIVQRCAAKHQFPILPLDLSLVATDEEIEGIKGFDIADLVELRLKSKSADEIANELECAIQISLDEIHFGGGGDDDDGGDGGDDGGDGFADLTVRYDLNHVLDTETFEKNCLQTLFAEDWAVLDGAFYRYLASSGYWERQEDAAVKKILADKAGKAYKLIFSSPNAPPQRLHCFMTASKIDSSFKCCRAALTVSNLPANEHLIAFLNGTLDIRTGELQPHNRNNFLTWGMATEYSSNADIPEAFEAFINRAFGAELIPLIRALTSMLLDPLAPFGYFPHLLGPSGSGKGTLISFWESLFAESSISAFSDFSDIATPEKRHQNLTGKKFANIPDIGGYVRGLRSFYELVDNGSLNGRGLFNPDGYNKKWRVRFAVASVEHLQIENAGDGWSRRCIPLPTKPRVGNPDPNLGQRLRDCRSAVISWALGMSRSERDNILINARNLFPQIAQISREAELYGDSIKSFIDGCLHPNPEAKPVTSGELYQLYRSYCRAAGYQCAGLGKFASHLKNVLPGQFNERLLKKIGGKPTQVRSRHWQDIDFIDGVFYLEEGELPVTYRAGGIAELKGSAKIHCALDGLGEGGLQAFLDWGENLLPPLPVTDDKRDCFTRLTVCLTREEYLQIREDFDKSEFINAWSRLKPEERKTIEEMLVSVQSNDTPQSEPEKGKTQNSFRPQLSDYELGDQVQVQDSSDGNWYQGTVDGLKPGKEITVFYQRGGHLHNRRVENPSFLKPCSPNPKFGRGDGEKF